MSIAARYRVEAELRFREPVSVIRNLSDKLPPEREYHRGPVIVNDTLYLNGHRAGTVISVEHDSGLTPVFTEGVQPYDFAATGPGTWIVRGWLDLPIPQDLQ